MLLAPPIMSKYQYSLNKERVLPLYIFFTLVLLSQTSAHHPIPLHPNCHHPSKTDKYMDTKIPNNGKEVNEIFIMFDPRKMGTIFEQL